MNERDYILAMNCGRLQMARDALSGVLAGDDYGLDTKMAGVVVEYVARLLEASFRAMDGKEHA